VSRPHSARGLPALWLIAFAAAVLLAQPRSADADPDPGVHDPLERTNRGVFAFNETLDRWILEPVATGWDFVVPDPTERAIRRFFDNLDFPRIFLNNLLQGKPVAAAQDVGRFAVNTTVGLVGFFDPATHLGLPAHEEDFGQTLGVWGVPAGPYLVLPLLGPSSPREVGGMLVDSSAGAYSWFVPTYVNLIVNGARAVRIVNTRSRLLETIREERKAAFDFYAAVRNAYVQRRENQVRDHEPAPEESDDGLYEVEEFDVAP
jgi:phospholipid-binding lipoprotein MlaA